MTRTQANPTAGAPIDHSADHTADPTADHPVEPARSESAPIHDPADRIWGLSLLTAYRLFWGSRGVQIVRRGSAFAPSPVPVERKGPNLYLLLEPDAFVDIDLAPLARKLSWLRASAMRLRITESQPDGYTERIVADDLGNLIRIERTYGRRFRASARAWITADPQIAEKWANLTQLECGAAWRWLLETTGWRSVGCAAVRGQVYDSSSVEGRRACMEDLLHKWHRPTPIIEGVYESSHGVWVHESAQIDPGARLIGPLWIGAGVKVGPHTIVGPDIIADQQPCTQSDRIDWDDLRRVNFILQLPTVRRSRFSDATKRLFDIVAASFAILLTLPIYPIAILLIAREDGWPPFFAHTRQTKGGKDFPCWKFRTMRKDAEAMKAQLMKENQVDGPQFFIANDPRLLKCGKLLRRLQIDELPQFWNVLLGHMSIVGPRPSPDKENQFCPTWREARLSVRPGITGLWQVKRTRVAETDFQEWIRYDLEYVRRRSWRLDLWIIFQTVRTIIKG